MSVRLFNGPLTGSYQASSALLISGDTVTLNWALTSAVAADIDWYLEFSDDFTRWFRETAQEDVGSGDVNIPVVVRNMQDNGGGTLSGDFNLSTQFVRRSQFARVQVKLTAGTLARAVIEAPFGTVPQAPPT